MFRGYFSRTDVFKKSKEILTTWPLRRIHLETPTKPPPFKIHFNLTRFSFSTLDICLRKIFDFKETSDRKKTEELVVSLVKDVLLMPIENHTFVLSDPPPLDIDPKNNLLYIVFWAHLPRYPLQDDPVAAASFMMYVMEAFVRLSDVFKQTQPDIHFFAFKKSIQERWLRTCYHYKEFQPILFTSLILGAMHHFCYTFHPLSLRECLDYMEDFFLTPDAIDFVSRSPYVFVYSDEIDAMKEYINFFNPLEEDRVLAYFQGPYRDLLEKDLPPFLVDFPFTKRHYILHSLLALGSFLKEEEAQNLWTKYLFSCGVFTLEDKVKAAIIFCSTYKEEDHEKLNVSIEEEPGRPVVYGVLFHLLLCVGSFLEAYKEERLSDDLLNLFFQYVHKQLIYVIDMNVISIKTLLSWETSMLKEEKKPLGTPGYHGGFNLLFSYFGQHAQFRQSLLDYAEKQKSNALFHRFILNALKET